MLKIKGLSFFGKIKLFEYLKHVYLQFVEKIASKTIARLKGKAKSIKNAKKSQRFALSKENKISKNYCLIKIKNTLKFQNEKIWKNIIKRKKN